jgi:hypothetical protein
MIKRTYEWYRVVSTTPTEDTIKARKLAVQSLVEKIDQSGDYDLLAACVVGAIRGFDSGFSPANVIEAIVSSIQEHQQAFPSDLADNAMELRVCASVSVGEIVNREMDLNKEPSDDAVFASAVLISGLGFRPEIQEQYLRAMIDELNDVAYRTYERAAIEKRKRSELDLGALTKMSEPSDIPTLWKSLLPFLKASFEQLDTQASSDREELDVLWWLFGNYSTGAKKHLNALKPHEAALCAGTEVADLTRVPSYEGVREMASKAAETNRKSESLKPARLELIVKQWNDSEMKSLIPKEDQAQALVKAYPSLFPLTWLASRIVESGVKTGWADEFEKKTGIDTSNEFGPATVARQVFDERVAQRIYQELA